MGRTFKYYPSSPFSPSVALGALLTRNSVVGLGKVFFETTETTEMKETTAKQSIIRMIINFSVVPAVPVVSFLKKAKGF